MNLPISDTHLQAAMGAQCFGFATIKAPKVRKSHARKYDCGKYGRLTYREIIRISGLTERGVFTRIYSGFKGEELCAPKHERSHGIKERCSKPVMSLAMKLARAFPAEKLPTVEEIRKAHPMCLRNAQRWRQAMNDARESAK